MAQPQTQDVTTPHETWQLNAKWTNGVAPGFRPTAGAGLVLNLSAGTSFYQTTRFSYAGGTLTLANNATNYVFLDTTASNAPASNTTGYPTTGLPIGTVVTAGGLITTITDDRTFFFPGAAAGITAAQIQQEAFVYAADTGAANAYAVALSPALASYVAGDFVAFKATNANTGASTLNVNGLGAKNITKNGASALTGGEINAGQVIIVIYDGTEFQLCGTGGITAAQIQQESFVYGNDTGAANAYAVALSPALGSYVAGDYVAFKAANANTGASTLNINGLGTKSITKSGTTALSGGEIAANQIIIVIYDGIQFQMVGGGGGGGGGVTATQIQQESLIYAVDTGTTNAYAATLSPAPTLVAGSVVVFEAESTNTGACTLAVNGGAAISIIKAGGTALSPGDINTEQIVTVIYDGTNFQLQTGAGNFATGLIALPSAVAGLPTAGQLVLIYTAYTSEVFPANFSSPNSYGTCGTNPTASATYSLYKNGVTLVGTIVISTGGVFTFATTSGASFTLNAGDRLTAVAPGTQDATLADVSFTLVGTRVGSVALAASPVFTWRGTYNGSTTYNPWDVVSYTTGGATSSYVCTAMSTGNVPTNVSFWSLMASAGANGTVTPGQIQDQAFTYADDTGTANAYAIAISPAVTLADGVGFEFKALNANTGASTLAVNGGAAVAIKKSGGTALTGGEISSGQIISVTYDGTNFQMVGGGGGDTTAKYIIGATDAALSNALVWPALYTSPDAPPASPTAWDDEFDAGSLNLSLWTWLNQGAATATLSKSRLNLGMTSNNGSTQNHRIIYQALPGVSVWEFTAKITLYVLQMNQYGEGGMTLIESSTSKVSTLIWSSNGGEGVNIYARGLNNYSGGGTFITHYQSSSVSRGIGEAVTAFFRIGRNSGGLYYQISDPWDGTFFQTLSSGIALTTDFTTGPNRVGLYINPYSQPTNMIVDWFRRTV